MNLVQDNLIIVIPARMQSTRLPGKPLADIGGKPMISHVWSRAIAANLGRVIVATDSDEIANIIRTAGGEAVLTPADLPSGSDRIYAALLEIDPTGKYQKIINLQGDLPEIDPALLRQLATILDENDWDIATLVAPACKKEAALPQIVKAVVSFPQDGQTGRALYFSRAQIPYHSASDDIATFYHHIGIYGWRRDALHQFVNLSPSPLEILEKLEQLRALEAGMKIGVGLTSHAPGGIDTKEDLEACQRRFAQMNFAQHTKNS